MGRRSKNSKCQTCKFRASTQDPWECDFLYFNGVRRNCEPGDKCTKYEKGPRLSGTLYSKLLFEYN